MNTIVKLKKKTKKIDTFLYQHFKRTGHSPDNVLVQPVEKLIYDENSSVIFNTIKRFETELKWIKLCLFIILLVQFGLLSGHLLVNSCPLG